MQSDNALAEAIKISTSTSLIPTQHTTEVELKETYTHDQQQMNLIPIVWEGIVFRKGDWLPRWEEVYMTMNGIYIRFYESRTKYRELQEQEEKMKRARIPVGSPLHVKTRINRAATFTAPVTSTSTLLHEKNKYLTLENVIKASSGRPHGLTISVAERRVIQIAVESEIERVVWLHLLKAALDQVKESSIHEDFSFISRPWAPILINPLVFYQAWGFLQSRKGNFAECIPCIHPNVTITSNYPPSVPIAGEYHGYEGILCLFTRLHSGVEISHYSVEHVARDGDLAVVSGWETIKNVVNGRKFRQLWKHELRFEADGRISHINMIANKTAAAVAFGMQAEGPSLALPSEQEESSASCPPGELRVVCICGEQIRKRKSSVSTSSDLKIVVGLNGFPHWTLKSSMSHRSLMTSQAPNGSTKIYSTALCSSKQMGNNGKVAFWAEALSIQFSGAIPGTSTCLYVEIWHQSLIGDELVGCTKINVAHHLVISSGSKEEIALCAIPKWYILQRPEKFGAFSPSKPNGEENEESGCGRLQLSISFTPYTEESESSSVSPIAPPLGVDGITLSPRPHRKSFDRLQALHEETDAKQKHHESERRSLSSVQASSITASVRNSIQSEKGNLSTRTETNSGNTDMYSFTVDSTKFRIYTRYQLIRAIGHGAYGIVIAASDQITGNSVAIKNIPKTFDDLVDAKRIVREIRLMRHLRAHPNVVTISDLMRPPSLKTFEDTYIVTDLMETDLYRVINSQEPLSLDHIAYITYQMLCALQYIHSAQIIHRDIKPSNILINRDCLVKICDFGLARGIGTPTDGVHDQETEQALTEYVVTRWYRAPELLLASKYTTAIDVWSIGCIVVEMFTRKPLFPGHDHVHQLNLILQLLGTPTSEELSFITNTKAKRWMYKQPQQVGKSLSSICSSASTEAIDLIQQLLAFDPRKRISVEQALQHPFLTTFRKPEMETKAESPFDFSFERHHELDRDTLRCLIFEDICAFHPEASEELEQYRQEQQNLDELGTRSQEQKLQSHKINVL